MAPENRLISFEGIDFCGKSLQAELLVKKLQARRLPVLLVREPGGTGTSEKIREILLHSKPGEISARTELFLYAAARAQLVEERIIPALREKVIVVCDRFVDSSTAYQGYGRQIDLELVKQANHIATQGLEPALTFILDISFEEASRRKQAMGGQLDRMEGENADFHRRVREGYRQIAEANPHRVVCLDGTKSIPVLEEEIWAIVTQRIPGVKG